MIVAKQRRNTMLRDGSRMSCRGQSRRLGGKVPDLAAGRTVEAAHHFQRVAHPTGLAPVSVIGRTVKRSPEQRCLNPGLTGGCPVFALVPGIKLVRGFAGDLFSARRGHPCQVPGCSLISGQAFPGADDRPAPLPPISIARPTRIPGPGPRFRRALEGFLGWFSIGLGVTSLLAPRGMARFVGARGIARTRPSCSWWACRSWPAASGS